MKIALVYSIKCSIYLPQGGFDISQLYGNYGMTGSESGFFNTAWGLAELGHEVDAYCLTKEAVPRCTKLAGANVVPIMANNKMPQDYDAIIAWNDPSHLPLVRNKAVRIVSQQLNDFTISSPDYRKRTDFYAMPSGLHAQYLIAKSGVPPEQAVVIPNSTNVEFFEPEAPKEPGTMLYCSSPDRGLHRLLDIFPKVRERVPHAKLKVFYRFWPWYEGTKDSKDLVGARARYIKAKLDEIGTEGQNGLTLVGPIPNRELAKELSRTALMVYPCSTVRFTEGFSIATLDGCASGCLPVISDIDALGSIYQGNTVVIPGPVWKNIDVWADTVASLLEDEPLRLKLARHARKFAEGFSRQAVAKMWEEFIVSKI